MNRHITSCHIKEKPFQCQFCPMSFSRKDEEGRHVSLVHGTLKPIKSELAISDVAGHYHQCPECSFHCRRSDKLKIHILNAHTDDRSHACNFCAKRFKLKDKLNLHVNSVHLKRKPFECQFCKQCFGRKDAAKRHETKWCSLRVISME